MFCGPHRARVCTQRRGRSIVLLWPKTTWRLCTLGRRNTIICFRPKQSPRQFPGKQWKCSFAKWLKLKLAPPMAGQEKIPWITLCGSPHSGSTNSGSPHIAHNRRQASWTTLRKNRHIKAQHARNQYQRLVCLWSNFPRRFRIGDLGAPMLPRLDGERAGPRRSGTEAERDKTAVAGRRRSGT